MGDETWTDDTCLAMIQGGGKDGERAVAVLYTRYKAPLYNHLCWRFSALAKEEVEDRVHEAFLRFIQAITHKTLNNETFAVRSLRAWLWTIAINTTLDFLDSAGYRTRAHDDLDNVEGNHPMAYETTPAPNAGPDDGIVDCVDRAWKAFTAQEPERAEVLRLRMVEGWSLQELAARLQKTNGAMREYISQCRKKFRPYLERGCGEQTPTASGR